MMTVRDEPAAGPNEASASADTGTPEASTSAVAGRPEGKKSSFGLARLWRCVDISPELVLPPEKLASTPSAADGCDQELEASLRFLGCELIQSMAILLRLPQVAAATGQVLYQRYFYSKSFARNNYEHCAMACVGLASKIEEAPRRVRDVVNVFHFLKQTARLRSVRSAKRPKPMVLGPEYVTLKNSVIKAERRVLKELGFVVHVKHPHKLIQAYLTALSETGLMRRAWGYMNDGLRTDVFVRYSAETIAAACIFLAARVEGQPLPLKPRPWWELFDVEEGDLQSIAHVLLQLYARPKPHNWVRLDKQALGLLTDYKARLAAAKTGPDSSSGTPLVGAEGGAGGTPSKASAAKHSTRDPEPKAHRDRARHRSHSRSRSPKRSSSSAKDVGRGRGEREGGRNGSAARHHSKSTSRSREGAENEHRKRVSPPRGYGAGSGPDVEDRDRKRAKRSRSKDRQKEKQRMRDREREVKKTLGKRRRSPSPQENHARPLRPY